MHYGIGELNMVYKLQLYLHYLEYMLLSRKYVLRVSLVNVECMRVCVGDRDKTQTGR